MGAGIVTGGLDTLYLGKRRPTSHALSHNRLSRRTSSHPSYQFHNLLATFLVHRAVGELTVAHMGFFLHCYPARHVQAVSSNHSSDRCSIEPYSIRTWSKPQVPPASGRPRSRVRTVSARFFDSRTICLQRIRVHTPGSNYRNHVPNIHGRSVCSSSVICVLINQLKLCITVHKLLIERCHMSCLIISICNVDCNCNGFRTMMATYPVGIGQVDADIKLQDTSHRPE